MRRPKAVRRMTRPAPDELLPIFAALFPDTLLKQWLQAIGVRLYWRLLTPLVMVWCLVVQRLQDDHTADAIVSYLRSGAVDHWSSRRRRRLPLSQRLTSESTSAYVQGRNRLPLALLQQALRHVRRTLATWGQGEASLQWKGHAVRVLDGTTFRLRPFGDLAATYGQAQNQCGTSYWVWVKSLASFCLRTQAVVAYAETAGVHSETSLIRPVLEQEEVPNSLYLADRNLGVYQLVQVAHAFKQQVLVRLNLRVARRLLKSTPRPRKRVPAGTDCRLVWTLGAKNKWDPTLPVVPVWGRLLYARLCRPGFRPMDLYLFTSLEDAERYPLVDLVALYGERWKGEIDYRQIKQVLEMDEFDVKSAALFRKELAAGLLTYNLICAYMTKAALKAGLAPTDLSFSRCARRLRALFLYGVPKWVAPDQIEEYILDRLAKCRLPKQPNKVAHEPRQVRRRPAVYPALKGSRAKARPHVKRSSKSNKRNS